MTLALLEGTSLVAAVCATLLIRIQPHILDWVDVASLLGQAVAVSACCIVAFYYNDLYDLRLVRDLSSFAIRLLPAFGVAFLLLAAFYEIFPDTRIANGAFVSSVALIVGLLLPIRGVSYALMRSRPFTERLLILGMSPLGQKLVEEIEMRPNGRRLVVGIADDDLPAEIRPSRHRLLGPLARLDKILDETRPDRIIVSLAERRGRLPVRELLAARLRGIAVEDSVALYEELTGKIAIESLTPSNLVFTRDFRRSRVALAVGRAVSVVASAIGVAVSLPLFGLIALAIRLDSAGPVFFVHERVGLHGRLFKLLKFRTMRPASGATSEWAGDNSDRITRVGRWLRKFRLDELPQFINILRGDMNLIGPRPHPVSNFELFNERIPYYALRGAVRPGVTGWAQVRYAYANNLEEETEKMRYDLYYIKHLSVWLDLRILVDSVKIVLFGRGAR